MLQSQTLISWIDSKGAKMTANIIDGKAIAQKIRSEIKDQVSAIVNQGNHAPGLAVIQVGQDPASSVYVKNKRMACEEVGMNSFNYDLDEDISQEELLSIIKDLNNNDEVTGILVQLPLPDHINETIVIEAIDPKKDVDGFHPYTIGRLMQRIPLLRPCTAIGVITMLEEIGIDPIGKHVVIVGASNLVGRPLNLEFLLKGSTTTVCHKYTEDLQSHVKQADILAVAVGKANFIPGEWIKEGAIVIDAGYHPQKCGDIDLDQIESVASAYTPVPGGVGPMTIACLLKNTIDCFKRSKNCLLYTSDAADE